MAKILNGRGRNQTGRCIRAGRVKLLTGRGALLEITRENPEHINSLTANASRTLGFLRRNLRDCPRELKQLSYFSLVRSRLEYASVVWDPYMAVDIDALERVQRRGARFVCGNYRREASVTKMLEELGWESLQESRLHQRLTMIMMMSHIVGGNTSRRASHHIEYQNQEPEQH